TSGAPTTLANEDGVAKHDTTIGPHVFTGSDTVLVAPVTLGDGAYTAAGSVITEDVPPGALGIARGRQHNSAGWVERQRAGTGSAQAAAAARQASQPDATGPDTTGPDTTGPEAPAADQEDRGARDR